MLAPAPFVPDNSHIAARMSTNDQRVLAFIVAYKQQHDGCAPVVREIMRGMQFSTSSLVSFYLERLEAQGRIRRVPGAGDGSRPGGIMVVGGQWLPPIAVRGSDGTQGG